MQPSTMEDISSFMELARAEAAKSSCLRAKVGAVLVKDGKVISQGYNGPIPGFIDCPKTGCIRAKLNIPHGERTEICYGVCAEQNAIIFCAKNGNSCVDSEMYTTRQPCSTCVKTLLTAGVKKIIYLEPRTDEFSVALLEKSGIGEKR